MKIGAPNESAENRTRVAPVPDAIANPGRMDVVVSIERGAGSASGFSDGDYQAKGAAIVEGPMALEADVVLAVGKPPAEQLKRGASLICLTDALLPRGTALQRSDRGTAVRTPGASTSLRRVASSAHRYPRSAALS